MKTAENITKNIALTSMVAALSSSLAFSNTPDWTIYGVSNYSSSHIEGADLYKDIVPHEASTDSNILYKTEVISDSMSSTQYPMFKNFKLFKNIVTLKEISELEENWNGYGGHPISPSIIEFSLHMLLVLDAQPNIFPTGRRSLQFEYRKNDKSYLEFEIFANKVEMLMIPNNDFSRAEKQSVVFENKLAEAFIMEKVRDFNGSSY